MRYMAIEEFENCTDRSVEIDFVIVAEIASDIDDEVSLRSLAGRCFRWLPTLEIDAANQDRELRCKVGSFRRRQPVSQRMQNRFQQPVRARLAPAKVPGEFVDPLLSLLRGVGKARK